MVTGRTLRRPAFLAIGLLLATGGCLVDVDPGNGDGNGGGSQQTIRVVVRNQTNTTLDPQVYVAGSAVNVDELFGDGNKFTAYGVGRLGLLGANGTDSFDLTCEQARVIGTRGGSFGDDLNNPDGTGRQIVLTQDLNVFCGQTLTLIYSRKAGGGFETSFTVSQ